MRRWKLWLAGLGFLGILLAPALTSADVNDFTVTDFNTAESLSRADKQGELHIIEQISVQFTDFNHGILRAIPSRYKGHSLQLHVNKISSTSGAPTQYSTYGSNGNTVLKIGDPNRTVTGSQEYTIDYTLRNVITFYKDHDELYWNVNGTQWQQPFGGADAVLYLPTGLRLDNHQPVCYEGAQGSTAQNCSIQVSSRADKILVGTGPMGPGESLTYVAGFQKGYFQPSTWYETLGEWAKPLIGFLAPVIVLGGGSWLYWLRRGRDPKGSGVIVPQYEAPDGLKPMAVGTLLDFKLDNRDITATIIDLAIRGYFKIVETKHDHLLRKDSLSYELELVKTDWSQLDPNEMSLMLALFRDQTVGARVDISVMKNALYATAKAMSQNLETDLTTAGYFRSNPLKAAKGLTAVLFVVIFVLWLGWTKLGVPLAIGSLVGMVIAFIVSNYLAARTAKGVAAKEHILGLKLYLEVAEKDRLEKLQGPDAQYAANAHEPQRTVELFEKLLPYAMVLGVEQQWAKQFASLYTTPPNWYSGNWGTFNAIYLADTLNSGIGSAVNSAFSAPSSSSGSGFGGGGAGGGGGGGGGGGW